MWSVSITYGIIRTGINEFSQETGRDQNGRGQEGFSRPRRDPALYRGAARGSVQNISHFGLRQVLDCGMASPLLPFPGGDPPRKGVGPIKRIDEVGADVVEMGVCQGSPDWNMRGRCIM